MEIIVLKNKQKLNIPFHIELIGNNFSTSFHSHDCFEITYVTRGSAVHTIGDMSYQMTEGAFIVVSGILSHAIIPDEEFAAYRILFDKEIAAECFDTFKENIGFLRMFTLSSDNIADTSHFSRMIVEDTETRTHFRVLFEKLSAEYSRGGEDGIIMIKNLISELIILTMRSFAELIAQKRNINLLMATAGGYIEENLGNSIRVDDIAKMLGISTRHFNRAFKNFFNASPQEFITALRINKAKTMLVFTTVNITKIATACGFYDCTHFCKVFKKLTGLSPKIYRKKSLSA